MASLNNRKRKFGILCLLAAAAADFEDSQRKKNRRMLYMKDINRVRRSLGEHNCLLAEMRLKDEKTFFDLFRMNNEQFDNLLSIVGPQLVHKTTHAVPVSASERLLLTLRLLSTGDQQLSVAASYRLGRSTTNVIFNETCSILWETLSKIYLKPPNKSDWIKIADDFWKKWQFPLCLGALDGKHVRIRAPKQSGSLYYNYKSYFSVILLALADANYRFIMVDIGAYGRQSDGGIFAGSTFGQRLIAKELDLPNESPFPGSDEPGCFVFVGDAAFPLRPDLMRPYPGENLTTEKDLFNYRLSRARRVIENAFGILVSRWRIFERRINSSSKVVEDIIGATVCLHNFCMNHCGDIYAPPNLVDMEDLNGQIKPGEWRTIVQPLPKARQNEKTRALNRAHALRTSFANFFQSEKGAIPWQDNILNRGRLQN